jgi:regulator of cell morphogenesis and NO signaling
MLAKVERLLGCVTDAFCVRPPMPEVAMYFERFRLALLGHLEHEEREIFAPLTDLERRPNLAIGRAIARAIQEHATLHDELARIRILSSELQGAEDSCRAMRALCGALSDLERDLDAHFHLENELLFPRAEELERSVREEHRR